MEPTTINSLANLEAIANIMANGIEILGIATGAPFLCLCWVPHSFGTPGYSLKIFGACVVSLIGGLATPGIIKWSVASGGPMVGVVAGLVCSVVLLPVIVGLIFSPSIMAYRENRPSKGLILALNCCVFVPFALMIALLWASNSAPVKVDDGIDVNEFR